MDTTADRGWEHFPHDADIGICGWGPSMAAAFEQAALALTHAVTHATVAESERVEVSCQADDSENLFYAWINAVIYEMSVRQMLFSRFAVRIFDHQMTASLWGEPVGNVRHEPACEPKGATFTELSVKQDPLSRWVARCIVDV